MIEKEGPKTVDHTVPANSRATFDMSKDIGPKDSSIKVESDLPVIPERAMYRNNRREGHDSIGTTTPAADYYLAEGATGYNVGYITYVLVQNPQGTPTNVTLTYMTQNGQVAGPSFQMPANSRKTIRVNDQLTPNTDVSTHVHGSQPIIAERAMYWDNGTGEACHDSIGMGQPHTIFYLPDGQSSEGRETWTLVQNPNSTNVTVEISYLTPNGQGNVVKTETIPANSRKTFNMASHSGISGRAAIMVTSKTAGKKIMVERAMYWNARGAGTDTIGGYSD
jgi:ribosomal protein L27